MKLGLLILGMLNVFSNAQNTDIPPLRQSGNIVREGNMCGGMMPVNMISSCDQNMECVYTMGPMIADAPGFCRPICPTVRDQWGNCIPDNCEVWNDGCNSCSYDREANSLVDCTEQVCYTANRVANCERYSTDENDFFHCSQSVSVLSQMNNVCCTNKDMCISGFPDQCSPECASLVNLVFTNCKPSINLDSIIDQTGWSEFHRQCQETSGSAGPKDIPVNCAVWYDGCNTCSVTDGGVNFCSRRMCLTMGEQSCREHHDNITESHESRRECFDGIDNDNDGLSDCDDPDCRIYGRCRTVSTETGRECFYQISADSDEDGLTDCSDDDCIKDPRAHRRCANYNRPMIPGPMIPGPMIPGPRPMQPVSSPTTGNGH